MVYKDYETTKRVDFSVLVGQTLESIENTGDTLIFKTRGGKTYRQIYYEDCCASCSVEDICGDLEDLIGSPILMAEESSSGEPDEKLKAERDAEKATVEAKGGHYYDPESETWTFYKVATIKGSVTIRWYGSSNGWYSESATFEELL